MVRSAVTILLVSTLSGSAWAEPTGASTQRDALAAASSSESDEVELSGELSSYVRHALAQSPDLHAAYAHWDAEVRSIRGAAAPPDPTVGLGMFLNAVDRSVGPRLARVSVQQSLPWPTGLLGRHDAAVARAREAQASFDAVVLGRTTQVVKAYWNLWEVRATRRSHRAHQGVLDDLATTLRARLEVGEATLADLQQVDLSRARLEDIVLTLDAEERRATALLRAAVGGVEREVLLTTDEPGATLVPEQDLVTLTELALQHPDLAGALAREEGATAAGRVARARRAPGLSLSAEWAPSSQADPPQEPQRGHVMLGVGVSVPLWQVGYAEGVRSTAALQSARRSETQAVRLEVSAGVEEAYARVVDGARRVDVVDRTLLPQAEGTYTSLLGSYAVGSATVAQVLLAQRDLLELQILLDEEQAQLQRDWAELEQRCGVVLPRVPTENRR